MNGLISCDNFTQSQHIHAHIVPHKLVPSENKLCGFFRIFSDQYKNLSSKVYNISKNEKILCTKNKLLELNIIIQIFQFLTLILVVINLASTKMMQKS